MNISALVGILSFLIGAIYTLQAYMLPLATIGNPVAPKVFPLGLGILMTLLGLMLTIQEIKKGGLKASVTGEKNETNRLIALTCVACILYGITFNRLGYVFSTILFLEIILTLFNGKENWKTNTIVALSFSIVIYVVFSKFLGIILPYMPFFYI